MTDDDSTGLEATIAREFVLFIEPIGDVADAYREGNRTAALDLLRTVGVDVDEAETSIEIALELFDDVADAWDDITSLVDDDGELAIDAQSIPSVVSACRSLVEVVRSIDDVDLPVFEASSVGDMSSTGDASSVSCGDGIDVGSVGERLVAHLTVTYLRSEHGRAFATLAALQVVSDDPWERIDLNRLPDALDDPTALAAEFIEWGSAEMDPYPLFLHLHSLLRDIGLRARITPANTAEVGALIGEADPEIWHPEELDVPLFTAEGESGAVRSGVKLVPLPPGGGQSLPGLAIVPYGELAGSISESVPGGWRFEVDVSAESADWGLRFHPSLDGESTVELAGTGDGQPPGTVRGDVELAYTGAGPGADGSDERTLLGDPEGSRLALRRVAIKTGLRFDDGELVLFVELPVNGRIGAHPADFDGFLANTLPGDGLFYDFDATVGYSIAEGLYFQRGGTLETTIQQMGSIGPVDIDEVHLAALPGAPADDDSRTIQLTGAISATVELGPATGTVTNLGVTGTVGFPADRDGQFGPLDIDVGFKPPDGIGLAIDSGPVSGGGFLELDHENDRYAGAVQLHVGDLTLNAVGLLTTTLPDGSDGFSLLVVIAGEFTPVQLGFGFTLNGVGGLVGIHRSMKKKPLQEAVATGSLDSVLFPEDPVANAQRIITDLRAIFPPTRDTHVFGPMVRLGWGTPTLITADLGVVLEVPSLNIAILGRLSALLPDDVAPLIELNMDVLGFVDQEAQEVSIDASLFDSRVLQWSLSGDFALRSGWGQNPRFVLSAGGFHPEYEPPGTFPELDRVKASMGKPDDRIYVELSGYFALTTNTAQVGGKVDAAATAGSLEAAGTIWFDALFEFDPFFFTITFGVKFSVTYKGKGFSLTAKGKLEGPSPWYVEGRVEIDLKLKTIGKSFSGSIGSESDDAGLPPADVMSKLLEELERPGNWSAQRPADAGSLVTVRELDEMTAPSTGPDADEDAAERVLVHPLGTISVRQTVVPLDFRIEVFGNARPAKETKFTIEGAAAEGEADALELEGVLEEKFAPGQYLDLTEEEKLDSPSFESLPAGRTVESAGVFRGGDSAEARLQNAREATLCYETFVEDRRKDHWATPLAELGRFKQLPDAESYLTEPVRLAQAFDDAGAVATAQSRAVGKRKYVSPVVTPEATTVDAGAEPVTATVDVDAETDTLTVTAGPVVESGDDEGGDDAGSGRLEFDERSISQTGEASFESATGGSTLSVEEGRYVPVDSADMTPAPFAEGPVSKTAARRAIARHVRANPAEKGRYQVVERRRVRATTEGIR